MNSPDRDDDHGAKTSQLQTVQRGMTSATRGCSQCAAPAPARQGISQAQPGGGRPAIAEPLADRLVQDRARIRPRGGEGEDVEIATKVAGS